MQTPHRKAGKYTNLKPDPNITQEKFNELKNQLEKLKKSHPRVVVEFKRLAEMGDFSENAAYSMAKAKLRALNQRILDLEDHLKSAHIIKPIGKSLLVELGSKVTIEIAGEQKVYQVLGSAETDPARGIISHRSPIGSALMNHGVGEKVKIQFAKKIVECKIIKID